MRKLKLFRIVLATLFLASALAFVCIAPAAAPLACVSERLQILPSALSVSLGVTLVWLTITFLFGRVYCATVCPVGTLLDCGVWLSRRIPALRRAFSYTPRRKARWEILLVYVICLAAGIGAVPAIIEPWHIFCNLAGLVNPSHAGAVWLQLGIGSLTGILAGAVSAILVLLSSLRWGRSFCTVVCPIGSMLGAVTSYSFYHIEIDPDKCINCMECEWHCPSSCVKVAGRYVDDSRCIRCLDCVARCPNDAIRYQLNRNRPATPLFSRRVTSRH